MEEKKYWFPAKEYGFGWGAPLTWQGWLVLLGFIAGVAAGAFILPPHENAAGYIAYVVLLAAIMFCICWRTGEPLRWRWGSKKP